MLTVRNIVDNCLTNYILLHFTPLVIFLTNFELLKFKKDDLKENALMLFYIYYNFGWKKNQNFDYIDVIFKIDCIYFIACNMVFCNCKTNIIHRHIDLCMHPHDIFVSFFSLPNIEIYLNMLIINFLSFEFPRNFNSTIT